MKILLIFLLPFMLASKKIETPAISISKSNNTEVELSNQVVNDDLSKVFVFAYDVNTVYKIKLELYENGEYKDSVIDIYDTLNAPSVPLDFSAHKPRSKQKKKEDVHPEKCQGKLYFTFNNEDCAFNTFAPNDPVPEYHSFSMRRYPEFLKAFQNITYIRTDKVKTTDKKVLLLTGETIDNNCEYKVEIVLEQMDNSIIPYLK